MSSERQPSEYSRQLYERYKMALEESIASVVVWLLIQEKERTFQYLQQVLDKLLEIVKWKLMGETAQVLIEKEKTEHRDTATYQDFLSKYADMRREEASSVSLSKQWPMQ